MKFQKKNIRNIKHQFFFLPYPTFIVQIIKNRHLFYKCFICLKAFPTKYRLKRHLISKCFKNKKSININNTCKETQASDIQNNIDINNSSILTFEKEFKNKKNELSSYYYNMDNDINNIKKKGELKAIFVKDDNNNSIAKKYTIEKENIIGIGHFGLVFCVKSKSSDYLYAMKVHKNNSKEILNEVKLLKDIKDLNNVPKIVESVNINNKKVIIETLMGPSIEKLHWFCNNKFSELTVVLIGLNLMKILKEIHSAGIIHRDIKPSNICFGSFSGKNNKFIKTINLVDFGLGKRFTSKNIRKSSLKKMKYFIGSLYFASTSALLGIEQTPKDEIESLFYVLIYLKNGTLPWIKNKVKNKLDYLLEIIRIHNEIDNESLFKGFSKEIIFLFKIIKNMPSSEEPDYDMIIKNLELLIRRLTKFNESEDIKYDWEIKLKKLCNNFKDLNIKREDLLKVAFLKKGYNIGIEDFLEIFDY